MKRHTAPIIAAILLLLPVLYVGSYLALVVPPGRYVSRTVGSANNRPSTEIFFEKYRFGGEWARWFYWPLEQIDRKVRPRAWEVYPTPVRPITIPL